MTEISTPTSTELVVKATKESPKFATTVNSQTTLTFDKLYYHESGDVSFAVEGTLFKIHRFQLERVSAVNPVLLTGLRETVGNKTLILQDKVDEFRALCWALYAPPHETALQYQASNFKLKLALDLFTISHKYYLNSLQTFAIQLLVHHCAPPNTTCRTPELEYILRLSIRNNTLPLTKVVEEALLRRVEADQTIFIPRLINLAEELGMRKLQGKLYYHELVQEESSLIFKFPSSTAYNFNFPCAHLTEKQLLALFRGYRSLLHYWRQLPAAVRGEKLPQLSSCKEHAKCQGEWDLAWSTETLKSRDSYPPNFDILAALEKMQTTRPIKSGPPFSFYDSRPVTPGSTTAPTPMSPFAIGATPPPVVFGTTNGQPQLWMRACGQKELNDLIAQLKDTMADHFLGSQLP